MGADPDAHRLSSGAVSKVSVRVKFTDKITAFTAFTVLLTVLAIMTIAVTVTIRATAMRFPFLALIQLHVEATYRTCVCAVHAACTCRSVADLCCIPYTPEIVIAVHAICKVCFCF